MKNEEWKYTEKIMYYFCSKQLSDKNIDILNRF